MGLGLNGQLVHSSRCAAGLTVAAVADRLGVHADVIWAIERGDDLQLEQLTVATLVALANSLDLHPSELFAGAESESVTAPAPDNVILEAALLEHGATINLDDLALVLGSPLGRLEGALAALQRRLASTGARLHPVGIDRYVIKPNLRALTSQQWIHLGQSTSRHIPLTPDAATALYNVFATQASLSHSGSQRKSGSNTWRTDEWDESAEARRQLREQQLLDESGLHVSPSPDVYYSLGLTD